MPEIDSILDKKLLKSKNESKVNPNIKNIKNAVKKLGDPQNFFKSIHITGTNGKTSTAKITEAILREKGLKTGLFISPHLSKVNERIEINGKSVSDNEMIDAYNAIKFVVEKLTYFETLTVIAYYIFYSEAVDVAIIEVGVGGLWDATNVINSKVQAITPIDIDHVNFFGNNIMNIAKEKAGIIKKNSKVIIAKQKNNVADFLLKNALQKNSTVTLFNKDIFIIDRKFAVGGSVVSIKSIYSQYRDLAVPFYGEYQAENVLLAICCAESFLETKINQEIIDNALNSLKLPGRFELCRKSPNIYIDAAHNEHGIKALTNTIKHDFRQPFICVFGAYKDKDIENMLYRLEKVITTIVITSTHSSRSIDLDDLYYIAVNTFGRDRVILKEKLNDAIVSSIELAERNKTLLNNSAEFNVPPAIIITGSINLIGEARILLK
jgi:dihydrofolate synthase/folylpolyglutamate synthase